MILEKVLIATKRGCDVLHNYTKCHNQLIAQMSNWIYTLEQIHFHTVIELTGSETKLILRELVNYVMQPGTIKYFK